MAASKTIVEARGIHKHFGPLCLEGVDLKVAERELVFSSGRRFGKIDPAALPQRLEDQVPAAWLVDGIDMLDQDRHHHARQRIGMVFQSFNLYPHMTALAT